MDGVCVNVYGGGRGRSEGGDRREGREKGRREGRRIGKEMQGTEDETKARCREGRERGTRKEKGGTKKKEKESVPCDVSAATSVPRTSSACTRRATPQRAA